MQDSSNFKISLPKALFERGCGVRLFVPVFHDDGGVNGDLMPGGEVAGGGPGTGHDHGPGWNDQRSIRGLAIGLAAHEVINSCPAREPQDSA